MLVYVWIKYTGTSDPNIDHHSDLSIIALQCKVFKEVSQDLYKYYSEKPQSYKLITLEMLEHNLYYQVILIFPYI